MTPDISIIICTHNRCESLVVLMRHLEFAPNREVIVVCNACTDGTVDVLAAYPDVVVITLVSKSKSIGINIAVRAARGRALLFTDDDVIPSQGWVEAMTAPILAGGAHSVQGGIIIAPHLDRPWLHSFMRYWLAAVDELSFPPNGLVGANMAISRTAFEAAGGLDEHLGPGGTGFFEDTAIGLRIERLYGPKLYLPEVSVTHHFRRDRLTLSSFMATATKMAVSQHAGGGLPQRHWSLNYCRLRLALATPFQILVWPFGIVSRSFMFWYYQCEIYRVLS